MKKGEKDKPYAGSEPVSGSSGPLRSAEGSQILVHCPSNRQVITVGVLVTLCVDVWISVLIISAPRNQGTEMYKLW